MEIIKTEALSFTYPKVSEKALDSVSISVESGELVLLCGRVGSGKSTLLRLLKNELAPNGVMEGSLNVSAKKVAYVSQCAEHTFVSERVRGELAFALENEGMDSDRISLKIGELASFFNLAAILDKKLSELSGGEKACVAVAAAVIADADLLLLDEPLAQLDPKSAEELISLVRRLNSELGMTVIIASHITDGLTELCTRMILLDGGRLACDGTPNKLSQLDECLPFFPIYTSLFEERPLTVRDAQRCQKRFEEKPYIPSEKTADDAVSLRHISFAYSKNSPDVLSDLTLGVKRGERHFIIGANGSGKTTLLKLIAGIKKSYSGKVKCGGRCAYVPQEPRYLFTEDSVGEEISAQTAKRFSLDKFLKRHPYDLSGGQLQLLAFAKVSELGFDILLLDEPTKSLDFEGKALVRAELDELKKQGKTVIIVSHDLDFAGECADSISFLSDGFIALTGDRRDVLSSMSFYTTQIRRITASYLSSAVSAEDFL